MVYPLPRVVFMDLKLARKSGHYVLEWMAGRKSFNDIVRVVITGSDEPADLKKAYELGANSYFRKPLTIEQLSSPGRKSANGALRSFCIGLRQGLPRALRRGRAQRAG